MDILRHLIIGDWQSEPYFQHQNPTEQCYRDVKRMTNTLMDRSGCPASCWLLALMCVCFLLNHTACQALNYAIPMTVLLGSTIDISPLLRFHWWEPVCYNLDDVTFPSESEEKLGRFVGMAEHVGHRMTHKILTDDTNKVIQRSVVRTALDPTAPNYRAAADYDPDYEPPRIIKSQSEDQLNEAREKDPNAQLVPPIINITELQGHTFLKETDNGQQHRVWIAKAIDNHGEKVSKDPNNIQF